MHIHMRINQHYPACYLYIPYTQTDQKHISILILHISQAQIQGDTGAYSMLSLAYTLISEKFTLLTLLLLVITFIIDAEAGLWL